MTLQEFINKYIRVFNKVTVPPTTNSLDGVYFVSGTSKGLYIVSTKDNVKTVHKLFDTADYYTKTQADATTDLLQGNIDGLANMSTVAEFATYASMVATVNPTSDITGEALEKGQLVLVTTDTDTTKNGIYRFKGLTTGDVGIYSFVTALGDLSVYALKGGFIGNASDLELHANYVVNFSSYLISGLELTIQGDFNFIRIKKTNGLLFYLVNQGKYTFAGTNQFLSIDVSTATAYSNVTPVIKNFDSLTKNDIILAYTTVDSNIVLVNNSVNDVQRLKEPTNTIISMTGLTIFEDSVIIEGGFNFVYSLFRNQIQKRFFINEKTYSFTNINQFLIADWDDYVDDNTKIDLKVVSQNQVTDRMTIVAYTNAYGHVFSENEVAAYHADSGGIKFFRSKIRHKGFDYEDRCAVMLPYDYNHDRKMPYKLIIWCHGANGAVGDNYCDELSSSTNSFTAFLASKGFFILSANGLPRELARNWMHSYNDAGIDFPTNMGSPVAIKSIQSAYDTLLSKYNIDSNGCCLIGVSMGGLTANNLLTNTTIPVRSVILDAPVIDQYLDNWNSPYFSNVQNAAAIAYLFEFDNFQDGVVPKYSLDGINYYEFGYDESNRNRLNQYFWMNRDKLIGWNPPYNCKYYANPDGENVQVPTEPTPSNAGVISGVTTFDYSKYSMCYRPSLLIFFGINDLVNQPHLGENFAKMVKNGGQQAIYRPVDSSNHTVLSLKTNTLGQDISVNIGGFNISPYAKEAYEFLI